MTGQTDTIYALSTPPGRGGVAIIRVSGPHARKGLMALAPGYDIPPPRMVERRGFSHPQTGEMLDDGLVVFFKAPGSYTGEDIVEYHIHGGVAVAQAFLEALSTQPDYRMAEPGEFTRRAFLNGKLDLTAAEGVADLIHAETDAQRQQALSQMRGSLSTLYEGWRNTLTRALAHMEADIDFPDEDLPAGVATQVRPVLEKLISEIFAHLNDNRRGEILRNGLQVAVIGAPNAGKSSLVNALSQREVAIVSDLPGTTRDVIEAHLNLGGYPVILADTAGLRPEQIGASGHDAIESEGIKRARARANDADIRVLVFDANETPDEHTLALMDKDSIVVFNKIDTLARASVIGEVAPQNIKAAAPGVGGNDNARPVVPMDGRLSGHDAICVSAKTGDNLSALTEALIARAKILAGSRETPSLTRERHRKALEEAVAHLTRALYARAAELAAEDTRLAVRAIGRITGRVDVEDLLDVIFRDFCIGK